MNLPVTVVPVPAAGAEDVLVADDGQLYTVEVVLQGVGVLQRGGTRRGRVVRRRRGDGRAHRRTTLAGWCSGRTFDDTGRTVHDFRGDATSYHMVTGVREHDGRLWLGSLHEPALAVIDVTSD